MAHGSSNTHGAGAVGTKIVVLLHAKTCVCEVGDGYSIRIINHIRPHDAICRPVHAVPERIVNAELVAEGFAKTLRIKPNTTHATDLKMLQEQAKADGKGLWGECVK